MAFFDDLTKKVNKLGQDMTQKTQSFTDGVKLNSQIGDKRKELARQYEQFGRIAFQDEEIRSKENLKNLVEMIQNSEKTLHELEEQLSMSKGEVKCKKCGSFIPLGNAFCQNCGAKVEPPVPQQNMGNPGMNPGMNQNPNMGNPGMNPGMNPNPNMGNPGMNPGMNQNANIGNPGMNPGMNPNANMGNPGMNPGMNQNANMGNPGMNPGMNPNANMGNPGTNPGMNQNPNVNQNPGMGNTNQDYQWKPVDSNNN